MRGLPAAAPPRYAHPAALISPMGPVGTGFVWAPSRVGTPARLTRPATHSARPAQQTGPDAGTLVQYPEIKCWALPNVIQVAVAVSLGVSGSLCTASSFAPPGRRSHF